MDNTFQWTCTPSYSPQYDSVVMYEVFQWGPQLPWDAILSDSCTSDRFWFSKPGFEPSPSLLEALGTHARGRIWGALEPDRNLQPLKIRCDYDWGGGGLGGEGDAMPKDFPYKLCTGSAWKNKTAIWRLAIQETCVSRITGDKLRVPKPPVHHSTIVLRGLRKAINFSPIMPRVSFHAEC